MRAYSFLVLFVILAAPLAQADAGSPDLAVRSLTPSIASPHSGDVVTFTLVLANLGNAPSGEFEAFVALEGPGDDTRLAYMVVPSIAPGDSFTMVSDPWTAIAGSYTLRSIADIGNAIAEVSEANNILDVPFEVASSGLPDLEIASLAVSPPQASATENVTVTYQSKNAGNAASGAFIVWLLVDGAIVANSSAASLTSGQTSAPQTIPLGPLTQGTHALTLLVDPQDLIAESNESDNAATIALIVAAPKLADLALSCAGPTFPSAHVAYVLACSAQNVGNASATGVWFEASLDNASKKSGSVPGTLAPGAKGTFALDWGLVAPGSHEGQVLVLPLGGSAGQAKSMSTKFTIPPPGDLVFLSATIFPPVPKANETVILEVKVRNQGYSTIPAGIALANLILDGNVSGTATLGEDLVPGKGVTLSDWTLAGLLPGEHEILVRLDPENAIAESSETNNEKTLILPVSGSSKAPDLAVTLVEADFVSGGGLGVGPSYGVVKSASKPSSVLFRANVTNVGTLATGPFKYVFLVDGEMGAGDNIHPGLPAGESAMLTSYPWVAKPGPHKVEAVLDWLETIPEPNEANNKLAWDLSTPDLAVSDLAWTYETEGNFNILHAAMVFSATVKNAGPFASGPFFVRFSMDGNASAPGDTFVQGLEPGASVKVKSYQWTPKAGPLQLTVVADPTDGVLELDEADNAATAQVTLPDLVPKEIYWTPEQVPGYTEPDARFNFSVTNDGPTGASPFGIQLHVDGVPYAKNVVGPALGAGESAKVKGFLVTNLPPGKHVLKITLDDPGVILESHENNNALEREFTWPAKPGEGAVPLDPEYALANKVPALGIGASFAAILAAIALIAGGRKTR